MSLISFLSSRLSPREPQTQPPQNHTTTGIRYPHILRRATTHWWKGPAAIATTFGGAILAVAAVRFSLPALTTAEPNGTPTPAAAAALNLALASFIPSPSALLPPCTASAADTCTPSAAECAGNG
ncbi:hypothetical protein [Dermatophilus congolensis]|uniref:hypothetical protein n=1 Tax=Dermatophilus congolensis TaxID=1863 RepID=UPI0011C01C24|nr:hypothetical protein [Dermatophilus congolensis]